MGHERTRRWMLGLSAAGTAFSGYLSGVKLFTQNCAFNEPCPYFLGYPACWYGFAMFATMFLVAAWAVAKRVPHGTPERVITAVAALGTLFAGKFVIDEIRTWAGSEGFVAGALGLPTCVYGLVFYIALLVIGARSLRATNGGRPVAPTNAEHGS